MADCKPVYESSSLSTDSLLVWQIGFARGLISTKKGVRFTSLAHLNNEWYYNYILPFKDPIIRKKKQRQYSAKFYKNNKQLCMERNKQTLIRLRKWFLELKSNLICIKCSESNPRCLDFHHRDPKKKLFNVSQLTSHGMSKKRVLEEIKKCDPLCANCHRKQQYGKF